MGERGGARSYPFVSYPYEWTFGMLKDAALLHLELMRAALEAGHDPEGFLRLQHPVDRRPARLHRHSLLRGPAQGEPWVGYRQFCELFLYPLMLQAYKGVDFRPWLRGKIDGIPAQRLRGAALDARLAAARRPHARRGAGRAAAALLRRSRGTSKLARRRPASTSG